MICKILGQRAFSWDRCHICLQPNNRAEGCCWPVQSGSLALSQICLQLVWDWWIYSWCGLKCAKQLTMCCPPGFSKLEIFIKLCWGMNEQVSEVQIRLTECVYPSCLYRFKKGNVSRNQGSFFLQALVHHCSLFVTALLRECSQAAGYGWPGLGTDWRSRFQSRRARTVELKLRSGIGKQNPGVGWVKVQVMHRGIIDIRKSLWGACSFSPIEGQEASGPVLLVSHLGGRERAELCMPIWGLHRSCPSTRNFSGGWQAWVSCWSGDTVVLSSRLWSQLIHDGSCLRSLACVQCGHADLFYSNE